MSNVNKIIAKLHKPKIRTELGKVQDVIREYDSYYSEYNEVANALVAQAQTVLELANQLIAINYSLEEIYFNTTDILQEAQEIGLDVTQMPDKIGDILDLDAAAGLNRVKSKATQIYEAVQGITRDDFEHV